MPDQHERSRIEVDRTDRALIEQAAAQLRRGAIRAGYAGMDGKHVAFGLALVLDEVARHFRDLDGELRNAVVQHCREIVGRTSGSLTADPGSTSILSTVPPTTSTAPTSEEPDAAAYTPPVAPIFLSRCRGAVWT
jgi:hypothetical protein